MLTVEALLRVVDIITKVQSTLEHLILKFWQPWEGHEHLHWRAWRVLDLCLVDLKASMRQVEVASEMRDSDLKV